MEFSKFLIEKGINKKELMLLERKLINSREALELANHVILSEIILLNRDVVEAIIFWEEINLPISESQRTAIEAMED